MDTKRNRKERQSAQVYRIERLFKDGTPHPVDDESKYYVEGSIDDMLIVSVPSETPNRVAQNIQQMVSEKFKQDVLVITHNIEFMRATKLSPNEAAKLVKMAEDVPEGEEQRIVTP